MATDQGPVVQSALLRSELLRLRRDGDLTQEQVAARLEWSASKLIRIEGGKSAITKVDLDALLDVYGVSSESQRDRLQALNRGARVRGWWDTYRADVSDPFLTYLGYEAGASFVRIFNNAVIPGLLQTSDYAQEATAVAVEDRDRIRRVVTLRMIRQTELAKRTPPPRQYYVLDEAVIRRHVGIHRDPAIMPEQLRHIADMAQGDDRVTVRVVPFNAGAYAGWAAGPFALLEFDGLPNILYLEVGDRVAMVHSDDARVAESADAFEKMLGDALPAAESIEFIRSVADEMSSGPR
ncbi:MAG TPA: helix-turn-helix transcriptional regulator [Streptosporangiaceae bacterium]|nr:helix-turn-helix transcriptional regulator [Streptosporangiaceae bacterium]